MRLRVVLSSVPLCALLAWPAHAGIPAPLVAGPPQSGAASDQEGPQAAPEDRVEAALEPQRGGLTSDQVADRAVANSPTLREREAAIRAAAASADRTMWQFIPRVEGQASYFRLSQARNNLGGGGDDFNVVAAGAEGPIILTDMGCPGGAPFCVADTDGNPLVAVPFGFDVPDPPLNQWTLSATLGVPLSDYALRLVQAKRSSEADERAAELARDAEKRKVANDARVAYYNWLKTVATIAVGEQSLAHNEAARRDAQARLEAGFASRRDVLALDAQVASTKAMLAEFHAVRELAASNLAVIMGDDEANYRVGEDVLGRTSSFGASESVDALVDEALGSRLELQAFEQNVRSTDQAVRSTRAGYYPRLDGVAQANYSNPNQRFFPQEQVWNGDWRVGLTLTWVLNDALDARAQIRELRATEAQFDAQRESLARAIELEVRSAWSDRKAALAKMEHGAQARKSAEEAYRVAAEMFAAGKATTTDVLQAEFQRVDASLNDVNARIDLKIADAKLRYASGRSPT